MKVLFCHDGPINCDELNRYYSVGFNDKLFDRYAAVFEQVGVIIRVERTTDLSKYNEQTKISNDRYEVIDYPNYLTFKGFFSNKKTSKNKLKQEISRCDALIVRLPSFLGSQCIRIANKLNKPYLIELVGCPWDSLRYHSIVGKILAPYMYFMTKRQVKKATDVLYVTDKFLQKRYPTKGRTVACSNVLINISEVQKELKNKKGRGEKIVLGTAAVLDVKYKGQGIVIEAIDKLRKMGIDVEYRLAGSGVGFHLKKMVNKFGVQKQVQFCGLLNRNELDEFYKAIDIYIHPSLTEGMPRALIEAMSKGCYCIGTDTGGIPELIGKENCFKKANVSDMVRKIIQYYEDEDDINRKKCIKRSEDFDASLLEKKRKQFYIDFRHHVEKIEGE